MSFQNARLLGSWITGFLFGLYAFLELENIILTGVTDEQIRTVLRLAMSVFFLTLFALGLEPRPGKIGDQLARFFSFATGILGPILCSLTVAWMLLPVRRSGNSSFEDLSQYLLYVLPILVFFGFIAGVGYFIIVCLIKPALGFIKKRLF